MKKISYLLNIVILAGALTMAGCGDDDSSGPTIEEQQRQFLEGNWTVNSSDDVSLGGSTGTTGDWSDFAINFQSNGSVQVSGESSEVDVFTVNTYAISGTEVSTFTVTFDDTDAVTITRNGADNQMIMSFTISGEEPLGGKKASISGAWIFNLTK